MSGADRLHGANSREVPKDQRQLWQSAHAGTNFLGTNEYLVLLASRTNPKKKIYAVLELGSLGAQIDIPLEEHTPGDELRNSVNLHPTLWGDIDPEGSHEATETYTKEKLLAFLNRTSTGADTPNGVPGKFYDMLNLRHGERYGSVFISSHGGSTRRGYNFNATIEPILREFHDDLKYASEEVQMAKAHEFTQLVEASLPHLTVTPLPVDEYLGEVRQALRFLPRDWTR